MGDKKACPLNVTKMTWWGKLKTLFRRDISYTNNCLKEECAWWDEDGKQCALKGLTDIADVMWNDGDLSQYADSHQEKEIQKLQMYLMENHQGVLDEDKSPVENAIEILKGDENV